MEIPKISCVSQYGVCILVTQVVILKPRLILLIPHSIIEVKKPQETQLERVGTELLNLLQDSLLSYALRE